ncbi:hypothetical protein TURU_144013 [Turdus rufiventris]|nr:hypothetical protein TURU_144013 [Turdus rufiventris]
MKCYVLYLGQDNPIQGYRMAGKQPSGERPGIAAEHDPTVCPGGQECQKHPGLYQDVASRSSFKFFSSQVIRSNPAYIMQVLQSEVCGQIDKINIRQHTAVYWENQLIMLEDREKSAKGQRPYMQYILHAAVLENLSYCML